MTYNTPFQVSIGELLITTTTGEPTYTRLMELRLRGDDGEPLSDWKSERHTTPTTWHHAHFTSQDMAIMFFNAMKDIGLFEEYIDAEVEARADGETTDTVHVQSHNPPSIDPSKIPF